MLAQLLLQFQKQVSLSSIRLTNGTTTTADIVNATNRAARSIDSAVKNMSLLPLGADVSNVAAGNGVGGKRTDVWTSDCIHYIIRSQTL